MSLSHSQDQRRLRCLINGRKTSFAIPIPGDKDVDELKKEIHRVCNLDRLSYSFNDLVLVKVRNVFHRYAVFPCSARSMLIFVVAKRII